MFIFRTGKRKVFNFQCFKYLLDSTNKQTLSPHKGYLVMIKQHHTSWMKDPTEDLYSYKFLLL